MNISATAPGKVILCGEHAVVYRRPAIALPLPGVRATATISDAPAGSGVLWQAPDLGASWTAAEAAEPTDPADGPRQALAALFALTTRRLGLASDADLVVRLSSAIPIAGGLGSGAAIGAALVRALAAYAGAELPSAEVAALVWESERFFHGTPSGIDNTVVSYEQAIWYVRGAGEPPAPPLIEPLHVGASINLVVGDTGVRSPTRETVGRVREGWRGDRQRYESLFDAIAGTVYAARSYLAAGDAAALGRALDHNQSLLEQLGVSSPELDRLVAAARSAGAYGAKLSGGGGGGVMLALADAQGSERVVRALYQAGAVRVLTTSAP